MRTAFLGFWIAYSNDLPVGPTAVVLLGIVYAGVWSAQHLVRLIRTLAAGRPAESASPP